MGIFLLICTYGVISGFTFGILTYLIETIDFFRGVIVSFFWPIVVLFLLGNSMFQLIKPFLPLENNLNG